MAVIIAGTAGVGKTELGLRYRNVIDLESSIYSWDYSAIGANVSIESLKGAANRPLNKHWPMNYINAISDALTKYDFVLVGGNLEKNFQNYIDAGFDFEIFIPTKDAIEEYEKRFIVRGNSKEWAEKVYSRYDEYLPQYMAVGKPVIILNKGETLESYIIANSDKYPPLISR